MTPPITKVPTKPGPSKAKRATLALALSLAIAKPAEGLYLTTYYDPPGILTVCYGTTGPEVVKGKRYTLAECEKFINDDMSAVIAEIEACAPGLPVPVLAAFADAAYNLGGRIACDKKTSTAARYLAAGKLAEACNQLPRWSYAKVMGVSTQLKGLVKRRAAERDLCLQGVEA